MSRASQTTDTWISAATFRMGSDTHYPEESSAHPVEVSGFWIDRCEVTNRDFAAFVADTGYVTVAERPLDPADFPGAPAENLQPGSLVFTRTAGPVDLRHVSQWWTWTPGANWHHPEGPSSTLDGRDDHPVVHVAYADAKRYATWAGKTLPTEAQWELAARGGLDGATYTWGDDPEAPDAALANYWHGDFPYRPERGYGTTAPVGSYPAERARALRHGRQRVGMDDRLVLGPSPRTRRQPMLRAEQPARRPPPRQPGSCATAIRRSRARSSRAARSYAPTATASATGPPRDAPR